MERREVGVVDEQRVDAAPMDSVVGTRRAAQRLPSPKISGRLRYGPRVDALQGLAGVDVVDFCHPRSRIDLKEAYKPLFDALTIARVCINGLHPARFRVESFGTLCDDVVHAGSRKPGLLNDGASLTDG